MSGRRRWMVPEVVQTSAMDCGPACLAALLEGFGVRASYGRLREACQTDVDGTSIDTVEAIANQLGLEAQQILIPVDHVLLGEADALPAIAMTRLPERSTHFVVVWRQTLSRVQVMDPSVGRRWLHRQSFLDELYVHEMDLPTEAWREWAGSDDFRRPLGRRLQALGSKAPNTMIEDALRDPGWQRIATLDAATRMVQAMIDARGLEPGAAALQLVEALQTEALAGQPLVTIPGVYWSARAGSTADTVRARGAILVHVAGTLNVATPASAELAAALREPPARPWHALREAIVADGGLRLGFVAISTIIAAASTLFEALLFRGLFDVGRVLSTSLQLLGAVIVLVSFLFVVALVQVPLRAAVLRIGRHVELRLRVGFLAKLPRLGAAYLRSRPISDMAERSHTLHNLRQLPTLGLRLLRITLEITFTVAGLTWLAPDSWHLVLLMGLAVVGLPLAAQTSLSERDLRLRTHAGGLSRFYLDALLGAAPARTHGFGDALRAQHESIVLPWVRAALARLRLDVTIAVLQAVVSFGLAIAIVVAEASRGPDAGGLLLLVYWALALPLSGAELAALLRELPNHRNSTLRLLEPLGALEEEPAAPAERRTCDGGMAIEMRAIRVVVAGHQILDKVDVAIAPGEHVAIVGRSGAGKSTLFNLLLGRVRSSVGELRVDGAVADRATVTALREQIAWVDPSVYLWNDTVGANLAYGNRDDDIASVLDVADLKPILARLPMGLGSVVGEAGSLISTGEGQRVRFGRALARPGTRLVLLDEPFRGLDHQQRSIRLAAARDRWRAATLLCITHDIAETATFERVLVIDDGQIIEDGDPSTLLARAGSRYAALYAEETRVHAAWGRWRRVVLHGGRIQ